MTFAEMIYQHSLNLPESAAREALDFIEFLEMRYAKNDATVEQNTQGTGDSRTEMFLAALAGGLSDDFPDDIDDSDLGVDAPREDFD